MCGLMGLQFYSCANLPDLRSWRYSSSAKISVQVSETTAEIQIPGSPNRKASSRSAQIANSMPRPREMLIACFGSSNEVK